MDKKSKNILWWLVRGGALAVGILVGWWIVSRFTAQMSLTPPTATAPFQPSLSLSLTATENAATENASRKKESTATPLSTPFNTPSPMPHPTFAFTPTPTVSAVLEPSPTVPQRAQEAMKELVMALNRHNEDGVRSWLTDMVLEIYGPDVKADAIARALMVGAEGGEVACAGYTWDTEKDAGELLLQFPTTLDIPVDRLSTAKFGPLLEVYWERQPVGYRVVSLNTYGRFSLFPMWPCSSLGLEPSVEPTIVLRPVKPVETWSESWQDFISALEKKDVTTVQKRLLPVVVQWLAATEGATQGWKAESLARALVKAVESPPLCAYISPKSQMVMLRGMDAGSFQDFAAGGMIEMTFIVGNDGRYHVGDFMAIPPTMVQNEVESEGWQPCP